VLRCPATGQRLRETEGGGLSCEDGSRTYPVVDGTPILVDGGRSLFSSDDIAASADRARTSRSGPLRRLVRAAMPGTTSNPGAPARFERFGALAVERAAQHPARVLVIGGGRLGAGLEALARDPRVDLWETDVYLSERVVVACDGHRLPFADAVFDGVIAQAVLEHVAEPHSVVAEIHRVLRPAGVIYAETPFMQQVHEGAFDFTRFTDLGHRRLFRRFDEIDRGVAVGPASALLWALRYFARSLPRRPGRSVLLLDKAVTLGLFWLKHLDRALAGHAGAVDAASGFFFLGRRRDDPVDDLEIIRSYRGAIGSVAPARGLRT
jgi:SAM-dependent methyltransferase